MISRQGSAFLGFLGNHDCALRQPSLLVLVYFRLDARGTRPYEACRLAKVRGVAGNCGLPIVISSMIETGFPRIRHSPTVITSILSTTMKSALLAVIGVCAARVAAGDPKVQAILGDTETHVTGRPPAVSGVTSPAVTRKLFQVNGVDREWSLPLGQGLLIKG